MRQRLFALLMAMVMLFSLCLTGCQGSEDSDDSDERSSTVEKKEKDKDKNKDKKKDKDGDKSDGKAGGDEHEEVGPDDMAEALFEIIMKDDASKIVQLLGYANEAEVREDWDMEEGGLYRELANEMAYSFTSEGITVSTGDMQKFVYAFVQLFSRVELTAQVKEIDERAGTAVVTCTVNTFDSEQLAQDMDEVMNEILNSLDPAMLESDDVDVVFGSMFSAIANVIGNIEPTDETADFDVDFELADMEVSGKTQKVWVPVDAEEFGSLMANTAMGF